MTFYALCGSLRAASLNRASLEAMRICAPGRIIIDDLLPQLPLFNPDNEQTSLPQTARLMRERIIAADGLIIASPEYARGIAAPLKNALEWLVGAALLPQKPVMIVNTSPRAHDAQAQLRLILRTMSLTVVEEATLVLPLTGQDVTAEQIAGNNAMAAGIHRALHKFSAQIAT